MGIPGGGIGRIARVDGGLSRFSTAAAAAHLGSSESVREGDSRQAPQLTRRWAEFPRIVFDSRNVGALPDYSLAAEFGRLEDRISAGTSGYVALQDVGVRRHRRDFGPANR